MRGSTTGTPEASASMTYKPKASPYAAGSVYINFLTQDEGGRIHEAYGANYDRLVEVKRRYDPDGAFPQLYDKCVLKA